MPIRSIKGSRQKFLYEINNFSGGMNTVDSNVTVKENEMRILKNVDLDHRGQLKKRNGFTKISSHTLSTDLKTELENNGLWHFEQVDRYNYFIQTTNKIPTGDFWNSISAFNETYEEITNHIYPINYLSERKEKIFYFRTESENIFGLLEAGKIDIYNLEHKGFNLWLQYFYSANEIFNLLKNSPEKILKNLDIIGFAGVTNLLLKKIDANTYFIKLFSSNLIKANEDAMINYTFAIQYFQPNAPQTVINSTPEQDYMILTKLPNVPFKLFGKITNTTIGETVPRIIPGKNYEKMTVNLANEIILFSQPLTAFLGNAIPLANLTKLIIYNFSVQLSAFDFTWTELTLPPESRTYILDDVNVVNTNPYIENWGTPINVKLFAYLGQRKIGESELSQTNFVTFPTIQTTILPDNLINNLILKLGINQL